MFPGLIAYQLGETKELQVLTEREVQVLELSMQGLTDKAIGLRLGLGVATVHTYWNRIKNKTGGGTRAEIVAQALRERQGIALSEKAQENERLIEEVMRRAAAEEELMRNQRILQAVIDAAPDLIYLKSLDGRYQMVNETFSRHLQKSKGDIVGRDDCDLFPSETAAYYQGSDSVVQHTRRALNLQDNLAERSFDTIKFPVLGYDGEPEFIGGITREVTEKTRLEADLRLSEFRLRTGYEAANLSHWEYVFETGEVLWAESAATMHGLEPEEFRGTYDAFLDLIHPDDRSMVMERVAHAIETGSPYEAEFRSVRPDGSLIWILGKGHVLYNDVGVAERMIGIGMDITSRKRQEQQACHSEECLKLALSLSDIVPWEVDLETREVYRKGFKEPGAMPAFDVEGFYSRLHPEDVEAVKENLEAALRGEAEYYATYRYAFSEGNYQRRVARGKLFCEPGSPPRFLGMTMLAADQS